MSKVTEAHVGQHGVLTCGDSKLVGEIVDCTTGLIDFKVDGVAFSRCYRRAEWEFIPDPVSLPTKPNAIIRASHGVYIHLGLRRWRRTGDGFVVVFSEPGLPLGGFTVIFEGEDTDD